MATRSKSEREQQLFEMQQTLAQTQRSLAEAILALSSGMATGVRRSASQPDNDPEFIHSGTLALDGQTLYLDEGLCDSEGNPDKSRTLESLAILGKRIRLEFDLQETELVRAGDEGDLFRSLERFLLRRSADLVPMDAECIKHKG